MTISRANTERKIVTIVKTITRIQLQEYNQNTVNKTIVKTTAEL